MKEMSCGRVCSPNALLFLQEELQPVVSSTTVTGPSSLLYFYQTLSLFSWGNRVWIWGEKVNRIQTALHLPHRHKCVCVRKGGQSTMFAFLPGVGTLPLPAASRGQARCARRTRWTKHRRGGRVIRRAGDCCIFLWWLCSEGCASDLVKGESLPTSSLPWPWQWPLSLSALSLFYHKNARRPRSTSI